jgi:hypothetical protein
MSSRLEALPTELLQHIFESVRASEDPKDGYPTSTECLGLTSKRFRSLVIEYQFRRLSFYVGSFEELAIALTGCIETLGRSKTIHVVRCVYVEASGSRYHALEGKRVVELLQMFPNMRNFNIDVKNPKYFPSSFGQGVNKIFGDCCHTMLEANDGCHSSWSLQ